MIERLYVHNFRCLENFTLDLSGQPSALLIGKNGVGKSTVFASLKVLQRICRGPNQARSAIRASDFTHRRTDLPMRFELIASISGTWFQYSVSFEWPQDVQEARILDEKLISNGAPVFVRESNVVQLLDGAKFALDPHVFALPVISQPPPMNQLQDFKRYLAGMVLVAPVPELMTGLSEEPRSGLDFRASHFASCLRALLQYKPKAYGEFATFVQRLIPDFASIEFAERGKEGSGQLTVTFQRPDSREAVTLDFDQLSDGEKCFFLAGYLAASSAIGLPVVCWWDEPDNHLSISEVGQFIMAMRKIAGTGGQFVATTHHPDAIRAFADENTFVLTRASHLEPTVARRLSEFKYEGDLIRALTLDEIIG